MYNVKRGPKYITHNGGIHLLPDRILNFRILPINPDLILEFPFLLFNLGQNNALIPLKKKNNLIFKYFYNFLGEISKKYREYHRDIKLCI